MGLNKIVDFSTAKLLKEKGFDKTSEPYRYSRYGELTVLEGINSPTIAEVVMWLYEKHGIWIEVIYRSKLWGFSIKNIKTDLFELERLEYGLPTEAYEAAIEYVLTKLI